MPLEALVLCVGGISGWWVCVSAWTRASLQACGFCLFLSLRDGIPPYRVGSKKQLQREMHRSVKANGQVSLPHFPVSIVWKKRPWRQSGREAWEGRRSAWGLLREAGWGEGPRKRWCAIRCGVTPWEEAQHDPCHLLTASQFKRENSRELLSWLGGSEPDYDP